MTKTIDIDAQAAARWLAQQLPAAVYEALAGNSPEQKARTALSVLAGAVTQRARKVGAIQPMVRASYVPICERAIFATLSAGKRGWLIVRPKTGEMTLVPTYPGGKRGHLLFDLREMTVSQWQDQSGQISTVAIRTRLEGAAP